MSNKDFYRAFEDKHRGSRELIKERISIYLPFILPLKIVYPKGMTLDIGCGRGEWLELLKENTIVSKGIDLDEGMLRACRDIDLDVIQDDGISYLKKEKDESMIVISAFHVIEHISFVELQTLVQEAFRVLKPGGILILETPNPENIKVATENFYLDPTHLKPIPSEQMLFLTEFYGFERSKLLRLQEPKSLHSKQNINLLDVLGGVSPDYSIVAQKKADRNILEQFDDVFSQNFGLPLSSLTEKFENRFLRIEEKATHAEEKATHAEEKATHAEEKATHAEEKATHAEAKATHAEAKATHAEAKATHAEAKATHAEAKATHAEAKATHVEINYYKLLESNSWKITKPYRVLGDKYKWLSANAKAWITFAHGSRPRRVLKYILLRFKLYLNQHPKIKSKFINILNHFPKISTRLRKIGKISYVVQSTDLNINEATKLSLRAKHIYNDLIKKIELQKGDK